MPQRLASRDRSRRPDRLKDIGREARSKSSLVGDIYTSESGRKPTVSLGDPRTMTIDGAPAVEVLATVTHIEQDQCHGPGALHSVVATSVPGGKGVVVFVVSIAQGYPGRQLPVSSTRSSGVAAQLISSVTDGLRATATKAAVPVAVVAANAPARMPRAPRVPQARQARSSVARVRPRCPAADRGTRAAAARSSRSIRAAGRGGAAEARRA